MKIILFKSIPAVLMIAYAAVMWHVFLAPNYSRLKRMEPQFAKMEKELAVQKKWTAELVNWRQRMEDNKNNIQIVSKALPEEANLLGLMASFAKDAAGREIVFSLFAPADPQNKDFYIATPVEVKFTGHLDDLVSLILASSKFKEISNFEKLTLKAILPGNDFEMAGRLETYHISPKIDRAVFKRK